MKFFLQFTAGFQFGFQTRSALADGAVIYAKDRTNFLLLIVAVAIT